MPKVKPRAWQEKALDLWHRDMCGVVRVVTGGGKTVFAQMCMAAFHKRHANGRVVIVVPTTALLDQWVVSLTEDAGIPVDMIACYSGDEKPADPATVNVLVINTARNFTERLTGDVPAMLIVDECHRAGSTENARALRGEFVAALGLSATPEREYDDGFEERIRPTLGPVIFNYGYVEAARDQIISPFALHNVRVPMQADEQEAYTSLTRRIAIEQKSVERGRGSRAKLETLLRRRATVVVGASMRVPVAVKLAEKHLGQRTIIFHERVAAATKLKEILHARNRSVTLYHTKVAPAVRRDNLRLYRRGVYDILVCCRALDEGINVPETAVAIIASATASGRQRVQRLGRVLRPAKGKTFADIYTIYAADVEEARLVREAAELESICKVSWTRAR